MRAAIDFGISNTDVVVLVDQELRRWTLPSQGDPDVERLRNVLAIGGVALDQITQLAVTGGRHRIFPRHIGACRVVSVGEIEAIGRGGLHLAKKAAIPADAPILVISAGSGTAMVDARGDQWRHITGSGVGGGTLNGLGRLLIGTSDPVEIDRLARLGNPNGADLSIADVISEPIGNLPGDATAVNFGRVARFPLAPSREDLAAALVTLVAQVIGVIGINAARAQQTPHMVVIGHLIDMPSIRRALVAVGDLYQFPFILPAEAGYGTAIGALLHERSD